MARPGRRNGWQRGWAVGGLVTNQKGGGYEVKIVQIMVLDDPEEVNSFLEELPAYQVIDVKVTSVLDTETDWPTIRETFMIVYTTEKTQRGNAES